MNRIARSGAVLAATCAFALGTAGPALAATQVDSPGSGAVKTDPTFDVSGTVEAAGGGSLAISGPGGLAAGGASVPAGQTAVSCAFDARSGGCGSGGILPNGAYTIRVTSNAYTYRRPSPCISNCTVTVAERAVTRSFTLSIAPKAPTGVDAELTGAHEITVRWGAGDEPDISSYELLAGNGQILLRDLAPSSVCNGGTCAVVVTYPENVYGEQRFMVQTVRPDGTGDDYRVRSASTSATIPTPPAPSPSPDGGTTTGSTGGTTGGSTGSTGGSGTGGGSTGGAGGGGAAGTGGTPGAGGAGTTTGKPLYGSVGGPRLGLKFSTGGGSPLQLPVAPAPDPRVADGTYKSKLDYGSQTVTETYTEESPARRLIGTVTSLDQDSLWRSMASALILLLLGMHLRAWLTNPRLQ